MVLALVPGWAQWYLEHYLLGAVHFVLFVTALNGVFLGSTLQSIDHADVLRWVALAALATVWVVSFGHAYRHSFGLDRHTLAQNRELLLRTALIDYLRDELSEAAAKLEAAIELDVDWLDPDPLFHLGVVMLRLAERHAAAGDREASRVARRRSQWAFRTCLARDPQGKWRGEIRRESLRLQRLLERAPTANPVDLGLSAEGLEGLNRSGTSLVTLREQRESTRLRALTPPEDEPRPSRAAPPQTRSYVRPKLGSRSAPRAAPSEGGTRRDPALGMPRTRVTPRPYDRERLEEALTASDAVEEVVVVVDPALERRAADADDPLPEPVQLPRPATSPSLGETTAAGEDEPPAAEDAAAEVEREAGAGGEEAAAPVGEAAGAAEAAADVVAEADEQASGPARGRSA